VFEIDLRGTAGGDDLESGGPDPGVGPNQMSRDDARAILTEHLAHFRPYPYERLAALIGSCEPRDARGADGTVYQLEVQFFWDDQENRDIRVIGAIDGGSISAFRPMTDSFIKAPDGRFVDE
jgi:hypothetical protein